MFSLLETILPTIGRVVENLVPDKTEAKRLRHEMEMQLLANRHEFDRITSQMRVEQIKVNQNEALHKSIFVSGWRPFAGWSCVGLIIYAYAGRSLLVWATILAGHPEAAEALPEFPVEHIFELFLGMLGIGGMRTFDKLAVGKSV